VSAFRWKSYGLDVWAVVGAGSLAAAVVSAIVVEGFGRCSTDMVSNRADGLRLEIFGDGNV
jgi:hypothetical protein